MSTDGFCAVALLRSIRRTATDEPALHAMPETRQPRPMSVNLMRPRLPKTARDEMQMHAGPPRREGPA
jgi:hypothetical protein